MGSCGRRAICIRLQLDQAAGIGGLQRKRELVSPYETNPVQLEISEPSQSDPSRSRGRLRAGPESHYAFPISSGLDSSRRRNSDPLRAVQLSHSVRERGQGATPGTKIFTAFRECLTFVTERSRLKAVNNTWVAANNEPQTQGQKWPYKGPSSCSVYGSGGPLNFVCKNAGTTRYANSARGCLQTYWDANTGSYSMTPGGPGAPNKPFLPLPSLITFTESHAVCLVGAFVY